MAPRMTISIDEALRKEMDGLKSDINWSAVAASAFAAKVREEHAKSSSDKAQRRLIAMRKKNSFLVDHAEIAAMKNMREDFIQRVIHQAEWREGKAQQYPEDARNLSSAEGLRALATNLDFISPSDVLWARFYRVWQEEAAHSEMSEIESEALRQFAYNEAADTSLPGTIAFLRSLIERCERAVVDAQISE